MDNYTLKIESRIGGREENQDSFGSQDTPFGLLVVVCDGMGGAKGGKTAAILAINSIIDEVANSNASSADEILTNAIKSANKVIYEKSISTPDLQGMGTTVVAILINNECATAAHVGDSRIYQIRGKKKIFRTFDHSVVFELVRRGRITEEQARLSAESNIILRALGTKPEVEIETHNNIPYKKGDRFLLCSDGICGAVTEPQMYSLIGANKSVERTVEIITQTIDDIGINSGNKHDNLTAALIELNSNSKIKVKMDRKSKIIITILTALFLTSNVFNGLFFIKHQKIIDLNYTVSNIDSIVRNKKIDDKSVRDSINLELNKIKKIKIW